VSLHFSECRSCGSNLAAGERDADKRAERAAKGTQGHPRRAERPRKRDGISPAQPEDVNRRNTANDRLVVEERADGARTGRTPSRYRAADV